MSFVPVLHFDDDDDVITLPTPHNPNGPIIPNGTRIPHETETKWVSGYVVC